MTPSADDSNEAVIATIEANLYSFGTSQFVKWPRINVYDEAHLLRFECDVASAMFNSVHRARLSRENVDAAITAAKERYARRGLPFIWWVEPSSRPLKLGKHLTSAGFVPAGEMTGMAIGLTENWKRETGNGKRRTYEPANFEIMPTTDVESVVVFARTMCDGFEMKAEIEEPMVELAVAMGYGTEEPLINYVGYLDGRPVAASTLFMDGNVAGIYNVATVAEARRRGFGTAVTMAALQEASRRGCRQAVLHASAVAVPMYRQMGFNTYCYFHLYSWAPQPGFNE